MTIDKKIIALRKEHGWSQVELADKLGFLQPHINRWETGRVFPSLDALKKLSKLFGISIDTLLFDEADIEQLGVKDRSLLEKLKNIEKLSDTDKEMVVNLIDSLAAKNK